MRVALIVDGPSKKTIKWIEEFSENTRQAVRQTFFRLGNKLKKQTNADILDKTTKTGRTYWVRGPTGRRRRHQASAPGETHANLTGALRRSLGYQIIGTQVLRFGYGASDAYDVRVPEYAKRIEEGGFGRWGNHIAARPSLANNVKKVDFETEFNGALRDLESK